MAVVMSGIGSKSENDTTDLRRSLGSVHNKGELGKAHVACNQDKGSYRSHNE